MKQIINNYIARSIQFSNRTERQDYIERAEAHRVLLLDSTYDGNMHYCYEFSDALTGEKHGIISFSSDVPEEYLFLFCWPGQETIVLNTGNTIFYIENNIVVSTIGIDTIILGMFLSSWNTLVIVEELDVKIADHNGNILQHVVFHDIVHSIQLHGTSLTVTTDTEHHTVDLVGTALDSSAPR